MTSEREKLLEEIRVEVTTVCNWWMVQQQTLTSQLAREIVEGVSALPFFASPRAESGEREPDYKEWPDKPGVWMKDGVVHVAALHGETMKVMELPLCMGWFSKDFTGGRVQGGWLPCTVAPASPASEPGEAGEERPAMDWPDSIGNWWSDKFSVPCKVMLDFLYGTEFIVGGERQWFQRKEWEELIGPSKFVKVIETNPLALYDRETAQTEEGA